MRPEDTIKPLPVQKHRLPFWSDEYQCYLVALTRGLFVRISPEDVEAVSACTWSALPHPSGHVAVGKPVPNDGPRKQVMMHRFIMDAPNDMVVDHINGDRLDNRRENLRICTRSENQRNRRRAPVTNSTGYLGVSFASDRGMYVAQIHHLGQRYWLGQFSSAKEAAMARDKAALEMHGEFAALNFLGDNPLRNPD